MIVELCTDGFCDLEKISSLGIRRIELCSALETGGLTPSASVMTNVRERFTGDIYVMIRPRPGSFSYDEREINLMKSDIRLAYTVGMTGVVFGVLNNGFEIDFNLNARLMETANSMGLKTTFHRAIDLTPNIHESFKLAEEMGFDHVLTSGGKEKAIEGILDINEICQTKKGRTRLLAGSGINPQQIDSWKNTGVDGIHFTSRRLRQEIPLKMGNDYESDYKKIQSILKRV